MAKFSAIAISAALIPAAFFVPVVAAAPPIHTQVPCGARATIGEILTKLGERIVYRGVVDGAIFELFSSTASGSWTATITTANDMTCLVAAGEGGAIVPPTAPGVDA